MRHSIVLLALCLMSAGAPPEPAPGQRAEPQASKWTARRAGTPASVRAAIHLGGEMLRKKGARLLRRGKPVVGVWFPKRVASQNALHDGRLIVVLSGARRSNARNIITVRTVERGYKVAFSTIELERADRELLRTRFPPREWKELGPRAPLALVGPEEPVWETTDLAKARAGAHEQDGELQILVALQPEEKRGLRWVLPARVRHILGL